MRQVVRGLLLGAVLAAVLGSLARAFMHLVEIGMGLDPVFERGPAIGVVSLFVLSGAAAGAVRALDLAWWQSALSVVVTSAPVWVFAAGYANDKVRQILDLDLTPPWTVELVAMVAVIAGLALVTPYAGWRLGRPRYYVRRGNGPASVVEERASASTTTPRPGG